MNTGKKLVKFFLKKVGDNLVFNIRGLFFEWFSWDIYMSTKFISQIKLFLNRKIVVVAIYALKSCFLIEISEET
jgi:hypothetical protein